MKRTLNYNDYRARIYAGWMGKSIGGTIGARMENHKTRMTLTRDALWPETIMPNDDMDIQIVWLEAMQERGIWIESDDLAEFWQDRCWYNFCEYGVFLHNFQRGIHPPLSGTWNNRFFYESEGCPIRSEIWGLVCPGNPALAAEYARKDAQLDHGGASELCEMFLSAAAAAAFFDDDLDRVLDAGLAVIPAGSAVHNMVYGTRAICAAHPQFDDAWRLLVRRFGDRDASKALMNQAIVVMALTLGRGDFEETMRLAVNSGWDTDCTAATAGALLGIMKGSAIFPADWVTKMGKTLACGIDVKHRHSSFDELTEDTARLGVEIARQRGGHIEFQQAPGIPLRPRPAPGVRMTVSYPTAPWLRSGQNTPVRLHFSNTDGKTVAGNWRIELPAHLACSCTGGALSLAAGESVGVEVQVAPQPGPVWDRNLMTLHWTDTAGDTRAFRFGLGGARLWRVYGPYFDMWDTTKSESCPYNDNGQFKFPPDGDSWNHYARLDKPYLDEARLLKEDIPAEMPEQIQAGEDYLDGAQIAGFRGQACFYLVRELVAETERDIAFHITTTAPHVVWFDGKELARREKPREVSLQDGRVGPMNVGPTPKRLVIKIARQGDPLTFCAMPTGGGDPERKRGISMFADGLGDIPATGMPA
jgi:ADP-ribosylglycohydrolase